MQPSYPISVITLVMGVTLSAIAGYFSVIGLATIFNGAFTSVVVMAAALEISKVVAASWIYRCWSIAPVAMRAYMTTAVVILILITSMGIFGYLSKAHLEQTINVQGGTTIRITQIEQQIGVHQARIGEAQNILQLLDGEISTLQEYDRIRGPEGAIAVRQSQQEERESLRNIISSERDEIAKLQSEITPLQINKLEQEAEIGPLKYIAEALYGSEEASLHFDMAVRWVIIIIVCVFDPLAIIMILAGNTGIQHATRIVTKEIPPDALIIDSLNEKESRDGYGLDG